MGPFQVTILGCSSATPTHDRHPTSQFLVANDRHFLIDCGEAAQIQLRKFKLKYSRINQIFISHLHGDHIFGLPGLLSTFHLSGRTNELTLYAPAGLKDILDLTFKYSETTLRFPLNFIPIDPVNPAVIFEDKMLEVSTIPLKHRIPCTGFLFREKQYPRSLIKERVENIPLEFLPRLKKGEDVTLENGTVIRSVDVSREPSVSRSYAFCSDTIYDESIVPFIKNVSVLYHEATFGSEMSKRAKETFHSTAAQAATIAKMANAGKLYIGHYSARYADLSDLLKEARAIFPETYLSKEGETYPC